MFLFFVCILTIQSGNGLFCLFISFSMFVLSLLYKYVKHVYVNKHVDQLHTCVFERRSFTTTFVYFVLVAPVFISIYCYGLFFTLYWLWHAPFHLSVNKKHTHTRLKYRNSLRNSKFDLQHDRRKNGGKEQQSHVYASLSSLLFYFIGMI